MAFGQPDLGIKLKTTVATLTASPNVCELEKEQRSCSMSVALLWEVPKASNFCVFVEPVTAPLKCWDNKWSGVYSFDFQSGTDGTFLLKREGNDNVEATAKVRVVSAIDQPNRSRKRTGFWRIF